MKVIKLTNEHIDAIKPLFMVPKFMGVETESNYFVGPNLKFDEFYHEAFSETYLSGLKSYHAYGAYDDNNNIIGLMGFYESTDDSSWYWNTIRTLGDNKSAIRALLDKVMEYNESNGRYKFYSMFPKKYANVYRRLAFSPEASERYDYFDEYYVEAKHQCKFNFVWQILYNRTLVPVDTIVRCTFLKQKYRQNVYNAGRL